MSKTKQVLGSLVGNVLEWYGFSIYGFLAPVLSHLFFPHLTPWFALLAVFLVFFSSYLMRPLGALLYGHMGDTKGRKAALISSFMLMSLPTLLISLLPTYHSIGVLAPTLLLVLRLAEGVAVGGEIGGSITYMVEIAPPLERSFYASLTIASCMVGVMLAASVVTLVLQLSTHAQWMHFAWRIPFFLGAVVYVVGVYFRMALPESPVFENVKQTRFFLLTPILHSLRRYHTTILKIACIVSLGAVVNYLIIFYLPAYLVTYRHFSMEAVLANSTLSLFIIVVFCLLTGYVSRYVSRKTVMVVVCVLTILMAWPFGHWIDKGDPGYTLWGQIFFAGMEGVYFGCQMALLAELLPPNLRYTALALGYNVGFAFFAGSIPALAQYLIGGLPVHIVFSVILMVGAGISLIGLFFLTKTKVVFIPGLGFGEKLFAYQEEYFRDSCQIKYYTANSTQLYRNIDDFLATAPSGRFTIVAHSSLGVGVALAVAEAAPDRVAKVVTFPGWVKPNSFTKDFLEASLKQMQEGDQAVFCNTLRRAAISEDSPNRDELLNKVEAFQKTLPLEQVYRQTLLLLEQLDISAIISNIQAKVLVVCNFENDPWFSKEEALAFGDSLPHAYITAIGNQGHIAPLTSPLASNTLIELWLHE